MFNHDWEGNNPTGRKDYEIFFANGGDRTEENIPELEKFKNNQNINFSFGVGGTKKINSSSKILKEWKI